MNKKKLYGILLCAGIFVQSPAFTQTLLNITPGNGQDAPVKINVQVDDRLLDNRTAAISAPGNKTPRRVAWIEYGDGQFTTSPESEYQFYDNARSSFNLMLVKSTGIYDQGGKPPKHTAKPRPRGGSRQMMAGNMVLDDARESVRITPNVFDVLPGDTMFTALTYRKPANSPDGIYRLLFFYNFDGMAVFEPIRPGAVYPVGGEPGQNYSVPFIRTHNGEQIIAPDQLPENIFAQYRPRFRSSGYLVFNIPLNDNREHHVFLTLVPRKNIKVSENLLAGMDIILVPPDNSTPKAYNFLSRISNLPSHDPNWQEVFPKCIVLPKKNQEMKHHIHFQNTGPGPARSVRVKTSLPTGLTANDIEVTGWSIAGVRNNPDFQLVVTRTMPDSIEFTFSYDQRSTRKVLYGATELPDAPVNAKTMGDIYFTCRAKPGTPNIMVSGTSIYFDNNEAVKTEETKVEFKKCCDCDKDCDKYKSKLMKWLMCKEC